MSSFLLAILFVSLDLAACGAGNDQFVYSGFAGTNLTLDGTATVTPSGLLELTNSTSQLTGHAFHPTLVRLRKLPNGTVQSFSSTFVFGTLPAYSDLSGHGIAFVISPSKNLSTARPSQYIGLLNERNNGNARNHIFAVELDPVQSTEFRDINCNHVGIDINSLESLEAQCAGYYDDRTGVFQNLSLISQEVMQLWVDYDGESTLINVTLAPFKMKKPMKPLISATYDLSTVLVDPAYTGFSSSTGSMRSRHYVLGWSFGVNGPAPDINITKLPELPRISRKPQFKVLVIIACVLAVVTAAATAVFLLVQRHLKYAELLEDWEVEFGPHRFSYKDLFRATEGFKNKNLIGVGGFGRVYKGLLPTSKLEVAVKRVSHDSRQGMKEFIAEVVSIGRLRHRNLVQLLGYCRRKGELLLIYDYMPNGSLDRYLYGDNEPTLHWDWRFQIIKDVASALLYLHEEWEQVVIHRDIKASNVLLDDEMHGRLGDFGLAKLYNHGTAPQTTGVVGTIGYLAPELAQTGRASPLSDVFAFGVFLLEVTCGRRPIEHNTHENRLMLVDWVLEHWQKGSFAEAVDARLQGNYDIDKASLTLKLGLLCSHPLLSLRPCMRHVMQYLDGDMPLPDLMPTDMSYSMMAFMQNQGFDSSYILSCPSTRTAMTGLSTGR